MKARTEGKNNRPVNPYGWFGLLSVVLSVAAGSGPFTKRASMVSQIASREICKLCYHVNAVGFSVPDSV